MIPLTMVGTPLLKYGAVALALVGLVVGALWYRGSVRREGYAAGAAATEAQVITNTIVIERKIRDAEQAAPRTRRAVGDSLRNGSF